MARKPFQRTSRYQLREALWDHYQGRYDDAWRRLLLITAMEVPKYANQTTEKADERRQDVQTKGVTGA